jgi:hypothetical protein
MGLGGLSSLPNAIQFNDNRRLVSCSPYSVSWVELKSRFATNSHRIVLANQFEAWFTACQAAINVEDLWIGGSFCSDCEQPNDIDVVLFYNYKTAMPRASEREAFLKKHQELLSNTAAKRTYNVDCALISTTFPPQRLIRLAAQWALTLSNGTGQERRAFYNFKKL